MIEQGVKDFTAASYVGVLAPAKTPPEIVALLEKALVKALADKGIAGQVHRQRRRACAGRRCRPPRASPITSRRNTRTRKEAAKVAGLKPE